MTDVKQRLVNLYLKGFRQAVGGRAGPEWPGRGQGESMYALGFSQGKATLRREKADAEVYAEIAIDDVA